LRRRLSVSGFRQVTEKPKDNFYVSAGPDRGTAIVRDIKIEVKRDSSVVVYTNYGVQTKPAIAGTGWTASGDTEISIGKDFNTVALYGAKVELAADGSVIVYTNGTVTIKPALKELVENWQSVVRESLEQWARASREGPEREARRAGYAPV
jgi:hypothetical protein